jgi:hypothetical protein
MLSSRSGVKRRGMYAILAMLAMLFTVSGGVPASAATLPPPGEIRVEASCGSVVVYTNIESANITAQVTADGKSYTYPGPTFPYGPGSLILSSEIPAIQTAVSYSGTVKFTPTNGDAPVSQSFSYTCDRDNDGVKDDVDKCLGTPAGTNVDIDGCELIEPPADGDNDGVPNVSDKCPDVAGPASNDGCPVVEPPADSDNDGVNDSEDKCVNEAGPASNDGCPVVTDDPTDAEKNKTSYWEAQYPGTTCVKYDNLSDKTFTVPAPPEGKTWVVAIVKAGSRQSLDGKDPNEVDESIKAGDVLRHSSGKNLSHVILCYKKTETPPKPADDRETRTVDGTPDCTTKTVPVWTEERTRSYVQKDGKWVPGTWSDWTKVTGSDTTRPATDEECPITPPPPVCESLSGAIFTTDKDGNHVNQNLYEAKADVYLQGGPDQQGAHLPDGTYYYRVTDPSGATVLSDTRTVVKDGVFPSTQLAPFEDTPNNGGEYKVWLSTSPNFEGKCTKTDNFKVKVKVTPPPTEAENEFHSGALVCDSMISTLPTGALVNSATNVDDATNMPLDLTVTVKNENGDVVDTDTASVPDGESYYNEVTGLEAGTYQVVFSSGQTVLKTTSVEITICDTPPVLQDVIVTSVKCGVVKVINPNDVAVNFAYGSFNNSEPDGVTVIMPGMTVEIPTTRTSFDWVAYVSSDGEPVGSGTLAVKQNCNGGPKPPKPPQVPDNPKHPKPPFKADVCVNKDGFQKVVPPGMYRTADGKCLKIVSGKTPHTGGGSAPFTPTSGMPQGSPWLPFGAAAAGLFVLGGLVARQKPVYGRRH